MVASLPLTASVSSTDAEIRFLRDEQVVTEESGSVSVCVESGVTDGFETALTVGLTVQDGTACKPQISQISRSTPPFTSIQLYLKMYSSLIHFKWCSTKAKTIPQVASISSYCQTQCWKMMSILLSPSLLLGPNLTPEF